MSAVFVRLPGELVSFRAHRSGEVVLCRSGRLWVTVDGEGTDHILDAGDAFSARGGAHVVVEALLASAFELTARPEEEAPAAA